MKYLIDCLLDKPLKDIHESLFALTIRGTAKRDQRYFSRYAKLPQRLSVSEIYQIRSSIEEALIGMTRE